jgi:PAS domain-containing protein
MAIDFLQSPNFSRLLFDAMPSPAFIVDSDVNILEVNRAARPFLGAEPDKMLLKKGGDVLRCIQAAHAPQGCGTGRECSSCTVRNSVNQAIKGLETVRRRVDMQLLVNGEASDLHALITVSPFEYQGERFALLILEDITELTQLRCILPICSRCKKIRNDQQYWEQMEGYLAKHTHIEFTHGICPECAHELYPDLYEQEPK